MNHKINEVIIIGCGISGIAASIILTKHQINHLILQSRDRIGGRIFSQQLDGIQVDLGAMIVHHPYEKNPIKQIMDQNGWKYFNKRYDLKQIMIGPNLQISEQNKKKAYQLYTQILFKVQQHANKSVSDFSFQQVSNIFLKSIEQIETKQIINFIKILLKIHGNIEGAEIFQISARDLYVDDESDVIPEGGYAKIIKQLLPSHQNIIFNQKVESINYLDKIIQVKTNNTTYLCQKLISSLPLGILKNKLIKFIPQLPSSKLFAIQNIGISVFNKIIVSFSKPFWDITKQYIILASDPDLKYYRIRATVKDYKYILCAFISGQTNKQLSKLSDQQIVNDFLNCLRQHYSNEEITAKSYIVTRWHQDEHSLGSYSYYHVRKTTVDDIFQLSKPINQKLWFIGEHCAPEMTAAAHAAFQSGIKAAEQISNILISQIQI